MSIPKVLMLLLLFLTSVFAIFIWFYVPNTTKSTVITSEQNSKALVGGPFSLINHHGKNVTNEDFQGKYMIIYFGYTFCPDICPTDLFKIANALDQISPTTLKEITPIFITFDPERDTIKNMADYVNNFHPKMVGLTGSLEQVNAVKKAYRVYSAKEKVAAGDDPQSYTIGHTSYIYFMDRNGEYVTHFNKNSNAETIAERLEELVH